MNYRSRIHSLAALGLALLAPALAQPGDEPENHWRAMAESDLRFVYDTIAAQHPGPLNTDNPEFAQWLSEGLDQALADLDKVQSYGGYRALLSRYVAGFRDGHLGLHLNLDYRVGSWPGFAIAWRDGAFRVHQVADETLGVSSGDRLVSCDGVDTERLFDTRVLPFHGKNIPGDRYRFAPRILFDNVNPLLEKPELCTFHRDNESIRVTLDWRWTDLEELEPFIAQAGVGPVGTGFSSREVPGGGYWLRLPTFGPSGADLERMKAIMAELPDQRRRPYLVVDVRGNGGGSSFWAEAFVRGLYGDAYYLSLDDDSDAYAVHRVSPENIAHFKELLPRIEAQSGKDAVFYRYFEALVVGLEQAQARGEGLYAHHWEEDQDEKDTDPNAKPLYEGTVYFLTDSYCGSACLDFADVVLEIPGVVHVGQPTSADTIYMEVRSTGLPSRNGRIGFATKFYRHRKRGNNEDYQPRHHWQGDIADTPAVEQWVHALQESQD